MKDIGCCPLLDVKKWHDKTFKWTNKPFAKDSVRTFFYMPLNIGRVMKRMVALAQKSGASFQEGIVLSDHTSKWNMDVYVAVDKKIKGVENTVISGTFYMRVYQGPYSDTKKWAENFNRHVRTKKLKVKKLYMWYTTCPACARAYGKNYVVFVAQIG